MKNCLIESNSFFQKQTDFKHCRTKKDHPCKSYTDFSHINEYNLNIFGYSVFYNSSNSLTFDYLGDISSSISKPDPSSSEWILLCPRSPEKHENDLLHRLQLYGLSPVCVLV